jgi:hypothetical protein
MANGYLAPTAASRVFGLRGQNSTSRRPRAVFSHCRPGRVASGAGGLASPRGELRTWAVLSSQREDGSGRRAAQWLIRIDWRTRLAVMQARRTRRMIQARRTRLAWCRCSGDTAGAVRAGVGRICPAALCGPAGQRRAIGPPAENRKRGPGALPAAKSERHPAVGVPFAATETAMPAGAEWLRLAELGKSQCAKERAIVSHLAGPRRA